MTETLSRLLGKFLPKYISCIIILTWYIVHSCIEISLNFVLVRYKCNGKRNKYKKSMQNDIVVISTEWLFLKIHYCISYNSVVFIFYVFHFHDLIVIYFLNLKFLLRWKDGVTRSMEWKTLNMAPLLTLAVLYAMSAKMDTIVFDLKTGLYLLIDSFSFASRSFEKLFINKYRPFLNA